MSITNSIEQIKSRYSSDRTLLVGIDGLGGAGKSTISEQLCRKLWEDGFKVTVFHIDDFIHPKVIRYNENYPEWECYYHLQWRYDYFLNAVIRPAKAGQNVNQEIALYDKENDAYRTERFCIEKGSIIITEGIFLQRSELEGCFDYMIYMDIPEELRLRRVLERDGYIGDRAEIQAKYENRYFPAERYYVEQYRPEQKADCVITEKEAASGLAIS